MLDNIDLPSVIRTCGAIPFPAIIRTAWDAIDVIQDKMDDIARSQWNPVNELLHKAWTSP
jgi:hypothetical protein